jgi:hypothetical protein
MEARGIVGALDGAKPREILMTRDQIDDMFANIRGSLFRGDVQDRRAAEEDEEEFIELEGSGSDGADPFVEG